MAKPKSRDWTESNRVLNFRLYSAEKIIPADSTEPLAVSTNIHSDIDPRERWELSEARYEHVVSNQECLVCRTDPDATIIFVNEAFCRYFGGIPGDYIGRSFLALAAEMDRQGIKDIFQSCRASNAAGTYTWRFVNMQGELSWMPWSIKPLYNKSGLLVELQLVGRNAGAQWQMQEALREYKACCRTIFENTGAAMIMFGEDGLIILANAEFEHLCGCSKDEIEGRPWTEFLLCNDLKQIKRCEQLLSLNVETPPLRFESRVRNRHGLTRDVMVSITLIPGKSHRVASIVDITERKQMQEKLLRLNRLNLVGEFAACIGHEVRNPITSIRGFLQMMGQNQRYAAERDYFDLMIDEIDRVNMIITEYLLMAREKKADLKPACLNHILESIYPLLNADVRSQDKELQLELGEVPMLMLDEKEIRQLVLNLARNGLESMHCGGVLTIRSAERSGQVVLEVIDQGAGIPGEIMDKIGVPFFTTKDNGTGLGLSVCHNIVKRHQASIEVESGSHGTCFRVRFNPQLEQPMS
ncbi:MAG: PAS domain S-box protein [Syntrophomonadaceae bacterium]|nr:PAS domain S-box protein [Syntrophomonadaceae bacterium]